MFKKYITPEGLKQLDNYKYVGGEYSWLDNKINPLWYKLANFLPKSMAPNLVTMIGFVCIISSYVAILFYDMTLSAEVPKWLFIKAAFEILAYQTFDALDGKQARRTGTSSPLGQLFDHGCDSFAITFFVLVVSQVCLLNNTIVYMSITGCQVLMFQSNWMEYHTHILNTQYGNFGVTEVELISMTLALIAGVQGQQFFLIYLKDLVPTAIYTALGGSQNAFLNMLFNLKIGEFVAYIVIVAIVVITILTFCQTIVKVQDKVYAISQYVPFLFVVALEYFWYNSPIYKEYAGFVLFSFGILFSTVTCKLITCSLTRMRFSRFHFPLYFFIALSVFIHFFQDKFTVYQMFLMFFALSIFNILYSILFVTGVIQQITQYLGIYCFSIQKRPRKLD